MDRAKESNIRSPDSLTVRYYSHRWLKGTVHLMVRISSDRKIIEYVVNP